MGALDRIGRRGAGFGAVLACALVMAPATARAAAWGEVFAAVADTVVFLGTDGALYRAPFHLAARETVWAPQDGSALVRFRASPDGRHVGFVTRAHDADLTRVWVDGRLRTGYYALKPGLYQQMRFEAVVPTVDDASPTGARLLQANALMQRRSATPVEWTLDGQLVFGFDDGIGLIAADSGAARQVSRALAMRIVPLDPAPILLIETLALREEPTVVDPEDAVTPTLEGGESVMGSGDVRTEGRRLAGRRVASPEFWLLYPGPGSWRAFEAGSLRPESRWVASEGGVWWSDGRQIRAVKAHDPNVLTVARAKATVVWLAFDAPRRALLYAAGDEVVRIAEEDGARERAWKLAAPARATVRTDAAGRSAFVAGDSLLVLDPADGTLDGIHLAGVTPIELLGDALGNLWVTSRERSGTPALARVNLDTRRIEPVEVPRVPRGRFVPAPGRRHLVLFDPGPRAPATLQVFDTATRAWSEVGNPGITAWEVLAARP